MVPVLVKGLDCPPRNKSKADPTSSPLLCVVARNSDTKNGRWTRPYTPHKLYNLLRSVITVRTSTGTTPPGCPIPLEQPAPPARPYPTGLPGPFSEPHRSTIPGTVSDEGCPSSRPRECPAAIYNSTKKSSQKDNGRVEMRRGRGGG